MSDPNRQKILDKIDASRDQAIKFLQDMVAIPSVTGDEAAIQDFLDKYLKGIGLNVDMWETNWEELKKHPGYRPVAHDADGVLQAMEAEGERFAVGVQWHPETDEDPGLFDGLIAAARERMRVG